VVERVALESHLAHLNLEHTVDGEGLTKLGEKQVNIRKVGEGPDVAVFVHGLGGNGEFFTPIIESGDFKSHFTSYTYDLEGHGLTPTNIASCVTIESFADDLAQVIAHANPSGPVTIMAHSLGCLIAITYALRDISKVKKLILLGPVTVPLAEAGRKAITSRANAVRSKGLLASGTVDSVATAGTSEATRLYNPVAYAAVRASLLSTLPEGYAKACMALVGAVACPLEELSVPTLLLTGDEDKTAPVKTVTALHGRLPNSRVEILRGTGHWHVFETPDSVVRAIKSFA
jgi:pimeloyl-ACP methyl ester carboxylesterase